MASYVATAIRNQLRDIRLVWAIESRCEAVVDTSRLIDELVDFPRDRWRQARWSPKTWRDQLAKFGELRRHRFEFGLDLQGHSKTALCLKIAAPKRRIAAFSTDFLSSRLNPQLPGDPNAKHRVERMMDAARVFGDFNTPSSPVMPVPIAIESLGPDVRGNVASISTGAGAKNKVYPADRWEEVGRWLQEQNYRVVFLGASSDPSIELDGAVNLVGKTSLAETMAVVAHSTIHLSGDTGSAHLAAAYNTPFVTIFGPTDPNLFRPYSNRGVVLHSGSSTADTHADDVISALKDMLKIHG